MLSYDLDFKDFYPATLGAHLYTKVAGHAGRFTLAGCSTIATCPTVSGLQDHINMD